LRKKIKFFKITFCGNTVTETLYPFVGKGLRPFLFSTLVGELFLLFGYIVVIIKELGVDSI